MKTKQQVVLPFQTPQRVLVYGSLRDRLSNNGWLYCDNRTRQYVPEGGEKETFTVEGFDMYPINDSYPYSYPFCVEGEGSIEVELYEVSPQTMYYLDQLEGHDPSKPDKSMYDRKVVRCTDGIEAIMYYMRPDQVSKRDMRPQSKILHGDWRKFMVEKLSAYLEEIK